MEVKRYQCPCGEERHIPSNRNNKAVEVLHCCRCDNRTRHTEAPYPLGETDEVFAQDEIESFTRERRKPL